jgi:hypothetical protein
LFFFGPAVHSQLPLTHWCCSSQVWDEELELPPPPPAPPPPFPPLLPPHATRPAAIAIARSHVFIGFPLES